MAQGTSMLTIVLPVGVFALMKYWQAGNVNWKFGVLMALGFMVGGFIGATYAQDISGPLLRKIFALYLLFVSLQMLFTNK